MRDNPMERNYDCFSKDLLSWYQENARKLPWRETKDPYAIWVSEVMLQQTRVETVIPYYHRFLKQFPTITVLNEAPEEEVLKAWEGLGYYRRARLLQQGVREVAARYGGEIPHDPESLAGLPGIGPYMVGSISSIAFNLPVPAVDGNVIRVVTRILAWDGDSQSTSAKKMITHWVADRFPEDAASDFTQALMELGALICLPRNPNCNECPVCSYCKAAFEGEPEKYPVKKAASEIPTEERVVLVITWEGKRLLIQRPESGLMAGFWEYPNLLADEEISQKVSEWTIENIGKELFFQTQGKMSHVYSHLRWDLEIRTAEWQWDSKPQVPANGGWFLPEEEKRLPRVAFVREMTKRKFK